MARPNMRVLRRTVGRDAASGERDTVSSSCSGRGAAVSQECHGTGLGQRSQ